MFHTLGILTVLLGPQAWAMSKRFGPAAHLTLLFISLISITAFTVFFASQLAPPSDAVVRPEVTLTYIGIAGIGLAGLVPLFWALEQMFPTYSFAVATVLAQALSLTFTATLLTLSSGVALPSALEWAVLALVAALYAAGLHVVHYGKLK